ncbi:bifunctional 4-hydroxy-2-oxoglutarate aldolase/2-dehydro-3-deoxy-phosphogluconate aldolase [Microbacterium testaceum]|uniref:2-dehydro-3-deoxyphosphogluconate aldolase n=1 Tax=Microbacterium testaceum TaxID=2033 RepID=A0A147F8H6_MICTE|nr:bifunctional 4-hydroxy-2-oxoglutarate aldolase/2-dehydro-3-deoxy-phosphogluconate aldolase [Microbacterium testaceum]KTS12803.1 hypothetical protein RSA3_07690 [Microbacterium testaceum]KTS90602.1 hypothetical protein NS183_08050 [Microbacterium testaceum]
MTVATDFFDRTLQPSRLMVILRGHAPDETVELCRAAKAAGAGLVEVPLGGEAASEALRAAVRWGAEAGICVGAGTVTSTERLGQAAEAGAAFTVAPGFDARVAEHSESLGLPHLPGVATPSEIQHARRAGYLWLKAFPAAALGPAWFSAIRQPFPEVKLVATGGINAGNAGSFLDAGASAVSLGSSFADSDDLRTTTS